jgi:hypothetical protein
VNFINIILLYISYDSKNIWQLLSPMALTDWFSYWTLTLFSVGEELKFCVQFHLTLVLRDLSWNVGQFRVYVNEQPYRVTSCQFSQQLGSYIIIPLHLVEARIWLDCNGLPKDLFDPSRWSTFVLYSLLMK